jgi:hypothetical protein
MASRSRRATWRTPSRQAEQQAGSAVPPDQRDRVYREILDQMIGYKLLTQESKARKVNVPDADVEAQILRVKQQFPSEDEFKQALAQRHMTVDQIRNDARQSMAISKLVEDEVSSKVAVKPEEVQAFYQQNPQNFQESEKVHASHILIAAPKAADAATKAKARAKPNRFSRTSRRARTSRRWRRRTPRIRAARRMAATSGSSRRDRWSRNSMVRRSRSSLAPSATSSRQTSAITSSRCSRKQPGRTVPLDEAKQRIQQYLETQNREKQTNSFVNGLRAKGKVEVFI